MHLRMVECSVPFSSHCDIDLLTYFVSPAKHGRHIIIMSPSASSLKGYINFIQTLQKVKYHKIQIKFENGGNLHNFD